MRVTESKTEDPYKTEENVEIGYQINTLYLTGSNVISPCKANRKCRHLRQQHDYVTRIENSVTHYHYICRCHR